MRWILGLVFAIAVPAALDLGKNDAAGVGGALRTPSHNYDPVNCIVILCAILLPAAFPKIFYSAANLIDANPFLDSIANHAPSLRLRIILFFDDCMVSGVCECRFDVGEQQEANSLTAFHLFTVFR
ncbi:MULTISPECIES: hypothetical protein [Stenotrophomonas]|uniref:hypothetical protein n=1 Tax=unclassified Stenotrophomonas TaxID=196198 RepID=UPI0027E3CD1A|nr:MULTISPECIES: hypothetical protein [Stenotrophomonas]MDQ7283555.1 hypothetical protein [Stenotrophomonas sp. Sm5341]